MANVKVAVRVRPLSKKEEETESSFILDVNDNVLSIVNLKVEGPATEGDRHRQRVRHFTFDFCYLSADKSRPDYASQELVYQDLGTEILDASFAGYNACLFAYGQTGSGKTYTMMGSKDEVGLIPRICDGLCSRIDDFADDITCQIEVSYLEIYNERVRDLLAPEDLSQYTLKVREHPKDGPYVQDLSKHLVGDHTSVRELIERGNINRTTAATHMHDASSRSHAIFTINFTQAMLKDNMPSEVVSKINLVDLAGSERADPNYSKGRLTEGANINKSLVTLGNCISALGSNEIIKASNSLSAASMESLATAEENYTASGLPRKPGYIPYRNSVLTWLLKDSLGGNSKTIMISTVSPSSTYFNETMSTLRYARRAKHIVNKPKVNEDQNVRLIRELRAEIDSLKTLLSCASLSSSQASLFQDRNINEILQENEQKVDRLTEAWVEKWREAASIMQECNVGIRRENVGVIVESDLPHLLGMDDDLLSTGIILYHLKEGNTTIGREDAEEEQDIVLSGPGIDKKHSLIQNSGGTVTLCPCEGALCAVNGIDINQPIQLTQGAVVLFGKTNMYRFNHPAEAAKLRERRASIQSNPEQRVTRKNSITLKVPSSALHEDFRQRSMSFSFTRDGNLIEEKDRLNLSDPSYNSFDSALSPIMMYNSGLGLERQRKMEVEKLDETRKKLAELQEKQRVAEEEHQEREEKMRRIYQSHQEMIERQRKTLERLRAEHVEAKKDAEEELRRMRAMLLEEKAKGEKKLKEELQTLKDELTRKAMTSAIDACVLPKVVAMNNETSQHLTELDVDRKRVTQLELLYRQAQKAAAAELHEKERTIERERNEESQAIAYAETKLADIENITFPWQRFSSRNSLESLVEETGSYSGESSCSNLDRVSPIGGRSDSDSNSGSLPNATSDNCNNNNKNAKPSKQPLLRSGGSTIKEKRNNSPVKNSQCNKKQNSKPTPDRKVRAPVKSQTTPATNNRTMNKSDKIVSHNLKVSDPVVKKDARKLSPARLKSSFHDRSPSPPKRATSPNVQKNNKRSETTRGKVQPPHRKSNESPTDSKTSKQKTVFSRLYKPQTPKFQYLKKKDRPLYGRDWIEPPDRSRDYHDSQMRKGLWPANTTPSPVRANESQSPERGTPELHERPSILNSTPKISDTPPPSKPVPSSRVCSNSPINPRKNYPTRSSPSPDPRKIPRHQEPLQSPNINSIPKESSNKPVITERQPSPSSKVHTPKNLEENIKPTRKSRRKEIVVSPPKRVCVEYVKPKITKPKEKTQLNMVPRKKEHAESFYVPMKHRLLKSVVKDIDPEDHDYSQTERQPAIGCSRSMEDVTLGQGFPLLSDEDDQMDYVDEHDFMEEQNMPSDGSSAVDDFPDSLDENEEMYGEPDASNYTEPFSYNCTEPVNVDAECIQFATSNGMESDISCDSLDDEDKSLPFDNTNLTLTPLFMSKENQPNIFEDVDDIVMDIPRDIDDTLIYTSSTNEDPKDNTLNIEDISVNVTNHDDLKRKSSIDGGSESDDESTKENSPPTKKLRKRQKKSRNVAPTCQSSDSENEDIFGVKLNGQIEIGDENDAVHVPIDNSKNTSESSSVSSDKKSESDGNSDFEGSLNLSGVGGHLSDSFNCDPLTTKDGLSSEEMPPLTEDNLVSEAHDNALLSNEIPLTEEKLSEEQEKKDNCDGPDMQTSIQSAEAIMNEDHCEDKQDEGRGEDQYTEDSDPDSSSEDSMEGGDYYVSAGVEVNRPLSDIKEEGQSSEDEDTDDSSQSTDTYSSPFSSADEEESPDENKTYNVYEEKEGIVNCKQCSSTDASESLISEDDGESNDSSSDDLQDISTSESNKPDEHFDADDVIEQEANIQASSLSPTTHIEVQTDGISDTLQTSSEEFDANEENEDVAENEPNIDLDIKNESDMENEESEDEVNTSGSESSMSVGSHTNTTPDIESDGAENGEHAPLTNDFHLHLLLSDKDSDVSKDKQPEEVAEDIVVEQSLDATKDFEKEPNKHKQLLQVGLQHCSTECESADELPCTEYRLVGQNYAIANAQLKMISLLLGTKSTIYSSDESTSPERVESPRRVPTPPKTDTNDTCKETQTMDKGINSISGDVTETVIQAKTVKADKLPQNLALISTFDSSQSPVTSHVVPVEHHMGDVVNASTDTDEWPMTEDTMPDQQHDIELQKSIPDWEVNEDYFLAKTDEMRFPPDGTFDNYSESVCKVSKLKTCEIETQTEEQGVQGSHILFASVHQMKIPEKDLRKSVFGDYDAKSCSGSQTEPITEDKCTGNDDVAKESLENSNIIQDSVSGISVQIQTDSVLESNNESGKISIILDSSLEETGEVTSDRTCMVSVATLTTPDDINNLNNVGSNTHFKSDDSDLQPQQLSKSTCDVATSPDLLYVNNQTEENEEDVPESNMKNAETQYEDVCQNSTESSTDEPDASVPFIGNEDINTTHETNDIVLQSTDSAFNALEHAKDVSDDDHPLRKSVAIATQTDANRKQSAVCQTDFEEPSPILHAQDIVKMSMGVQTDSYPEAIIVHEHNNLSDSSDELDSQGPTFSDSGIQVCIADDMKDFLSEGTSCHTADGNLSNDELSSLVDQGIQTEPILLKVIENVDPQINSTQEEEVHLDELSNSSHCHPFDDSLEGDSDESPVKSEDTSLENDDLQFLQKIKEMKDKAEHVASRAQRFTSKLRLSNMNDSVDSLDQSSVGTPHDQDNDDLQLLDNSLDAEEGISNVSKSPNAEIDHTASKEDDSHDTKISKLNSIRLNTAAKQIVYSQSPELTVNDLESLESNMSEEYNILTTEPSAITTNDEAETSQSKVSDIDIDQYSTGYDDVDSKDNITSELMSIKIKSQETIPEKVACTPVPEFTIAKPSEKATSTVDVQVTDDVPSENRETEEDTVALDFARFKLMICEQYVQQKMVLSEMKSFYQQLRKEEQEEEEEEKLSKSMSDKNRFSELKDICESPATQIGSQIKNTDKTDGDANHSVDPRNIRDPVNEQEVACETIDTNKVISHSLKDRLKLLPTIILPLENSGESNDDDLTIESLPSEQYIDSRNLTNKAIPHGQSPSDLDEQVDIEGLSSTAVISPDDESEDAGRQEQEFSKAGYHFHLRDDLSHTDSYSQRVRFLGVVDKQVVNLPKYGINFDLDESDEDLRALRKSHEDVERILEETSSPDSDLEDSAVEPELVALMDEIEKDHISVELAKRRRRDPPSLTEDQLSNNALKVPVNYKLSNDSQLDVLSSTDARKYEDTELDGQCLDPQNMRINLKPLSPVRPDWLTEGVLENKSYKDRTHSSKYTINEPFQLDRVNTLEIIRQESDVLKVTERSESWQSSSFNNSPYGSGNSTPKPPCDSVDVNLVPGSLTIANVQAIGALPNKFTSKSLSPMEPFTDVEILSDFQEEIPISNGDVPGDISDNKSHRSLSNSRKLGHNSADPFTHLQLAMDSSTQTDVSREKTAPDLQDESTEVDQALNSSDNDHFHISIQTPGNMLDRHDTSVELMEAKMMHGIGETDAWLRFLESDNSANDWMWFKNPNHQRRPHNYISQRQENVQRPHTSNGHYSLSVPERNHLRSNSANEGREPSPVGRSRQPSRQLEYLQKLRQDVVKATSQTETASENSGIDELLAEYQRTREQSQVEISKAKEKLKQQTKKEKQRLKDEMKYLRDIENQTAEARVKAEDHIRDERKRIFLEERQLLRIKDWSHRRASSEQDIEFAITNLRKNGESARYSDRQAGHDHQSRLNRTWHGDEQPLPNHHVTSIGRQSFSPDRGSVASYASSGYSYSPPSTDRSHTRSSMSVGSDPYVGSPVSDGKYSSPSISHRDRFDFYHSSFSTDDEVSPRFSLEFLRSFQEDDSNSVKNAKIKMMADPMLVEARYKESLERIKKYEKSRNCLHGHHQSDRHQQRGRSREHTRSQDGSRQRARMSPDRLSLTSHTPHRRSRTLEDQILQVRHDIQQLPEPSHNYRHYPVGVAQSYREYPSQIPPVVTTGDSDWEY